jgi:hypothetical protein
MAVDEFSCKAIKAMKAKNHQENMKKTSIYHISISAIFAPPFLQKMRRTWNQDAEVSSCR